MSAAPFTTDPDDRPPEAGRQAPRHARRYGCRRWDAELALLRREMPQVGFLFDGRRWWGIYGKVLIIHASDPAALRDRLRQVMPVAHLRRE